MINNQEPYGRFEGTIELPTQLTLATAPTETKFPWKWLIIGGLATILIICLLTKES